MEYLTAISGIYLTGFAFFVDCNNVRSQIVFRVLPGLIGVGLLTSAAESDRKEAAESDRP